MKELWQGADAVHEVRLGWAEDVDGEGILDLPPGWGRCGRLFHALVSLPIFLHLPSVSSSKTRSDSGTAETGVRRSPEKAKKTFATSKNTCGSL